MAGVVGALGAAVSAAAARRGLLLQGFARVGRGRRMQRLLAVLAPVEHASVEADNVRLLLGLEAQVKLP